MPKLSLFEQIEMLMDYHFIYKVKTATYETSEYQYHAKFLPELEKILEQKDA